MQFFGWADKNSMPIVSVTTDWGDDSPNNPLPRTGKYKNHSGLKADNTSQCDGTNFGRSADACTDQYFMFSHVYSCTEEDRGGPYFEESCPEDVNGAAVPGNGSCCVFKPKVQIKDNWGWCNGNCGRSGVGGCYDGGDSGGTDECDVSETRFDHWTSFAGQVIVVPK
jgi:hypothetical protein